MKYFLILTLLFSSAQAQDRTVYFPEVRENYNIYHPMIIKDTTKSIWVDSLTMRKLKGEYKVMDSVKIKKTVAPKTSNDYNLWPKFVHLMYAENGPWRMKWRVPCGEIIILTGAKNETVKINFSKHCALCKDVFPDRIYFAYHSNLEMK